MRGGTRNRGYTIVEVIIFLAISGFMFVLAASFVQGRQGKAEFQQGMNAVNTQVRDVMNDVGNGYFPSNENFRCEATSGAPSFPTGGTAKAQGTNQGCVFMGKVMHFGVAGTDLSGYSIYTLAGRQYKGTQQEGIFPTSFSEARPVVVRASTVDMTDRGRLKWGLRITKATTTATDPNGVRPLSGIGFFSSFGSYETSDSLSSGSQSTVVVPIFGPLDASEDAMMGAINSYVVDGNVDRTPNIVLCFEGGRGQFGTLTLGGGEGQRLGTSVKTSNADNICP